MCGFVGFTNEIGDQGNVLEAMMNQIVHRGPDAQGQYIDDDIALGFRRLSIIDLDNGSQPLYNEDKTKVLVFNGEIYNYQSLREELLNQGHVFTTATDSEVLLHGYEEYGPALLDRLRGMFSFVIWDTVNRELFGVRDFFGIKPLYYAKMKGSLLFGSEIKAFLAHPSFVKKLNVRALEQYLSFQYSPGEESFFEGVYKLPPAHYFLYQNGEMVIKRYWEPVFEPEEDLDEQEWVDRIAQEFDGSVEAHKISDVEVGSFLSSGVDSSYVACRANVDKTFTVGFGDEKYNEIGYAKELADYIHVENISKVISPDEYWEVLPKVQYQMDEPLADPAAVALYFVCQIASEHVKVVLSGEGADELFGGYNIYQAPVDTEKFRKLPRWLRNGLSALASRLPAVHGINFFVRGGDVERWFIGNANMFSVKERKKLLHIQTDAPDPRELTSQYYDKVAGKDDVTKMQYLDIHMWMAGDILLKADKMSMAHSLELRVPFLDKEIMALAGKIPYRYRVTKDNTKVAMRKAALRAMPPQTANKKKLGFPVPIRVWLKEDRYYTYMKEMLTGETAKQFFHTEQLVKLLEEHKSGKKDNSRKIWTVFSFLLWYEQYFVVHHQQESYETPLA